MATRFITKGRGTGRKIIPVDTKSQVNRIISLKKIGKPKLELDNGSIIVRQGYGSGENITILGKGDRQFLDAMTTNLKKYGSFDHINESNYEDYMVVGDEGIWGGLRTYRDIPSVLAYIQTKYKYKRPMTLQKMSR